MRLALVRDVEDEKRRIHVEFSAEEFRVALLEEYGRTNDVAKAFDSVCDRLRKKALRV